MTFPAVPDRDKHQYFWTYESLYRTLDVPLPDFDKASMDAKFGGFKHLNQGSTFKDDEWGDYLNRMFCIEDGYSWRPIAAGERLYDHPADGYTLIPVSHLKAGLRFPAHKFLADLFRYHFRCPFSQFTPNSIRSILWFIASCNAKKKQPTFRAFFN